MMEQTILVKIQHMKTAIPKEIVQRRKFSKDIMRVNSRGLLHCHTTVLLQEFERYGALIESIHDSLELLDKAVRGVQLMSTDLDDMCKALSMNVVPEMWANFAYPSLKSLSAWVVDL